MLASAALQTLPLWEVGRCGRWLLRKEGIVVFQDVLSPEFAAALQQEGSDSDLAERLWEWDPEGMVNRGEKRCSTSGTLRGADCSGPPSAHV